VVHKTLFFWPKEVTGVCRIDNISSFGGITARRDERRGIGIKLRHFCKWVAVNMALYAELFRESAEDGPDFLSDRLVLLRHIDFSERRENMTGRVRK
jgi:hypothetical protein